MEWIKFLASLAQSFFEVFANSVKNDPVPTAVVFLISFFLVWPDIKRRYANSLIVAGLIQFVATVFAASVIGWIFDASLSIVKFFLGATSFSASIFVDHPIEFIEHLLAWCFIAAIVLLYIARWRYRELRLSWAFFAIFPVLWITYISTNIHVHLTPGAALALPSASASKP
jgi:hypothetical protein